MHVVIREAVCVVNARRKGFTQGGRLYEVAVASGKVCCVTTTLQLGLWQHSPNNKDATDNVGDTFESGLCGVGGRRSGAGGDGEVGECELSATGGHDSG